MTEGSDALSTAFEKQNELTWAQFQLLQNNLKAVLVDLGTEILPHLIVVMKQALITIDNIQWLFKVWSGEVSDTTTELGKLEIKLFTISETIRGVWRDLTGLRATPNPLWSRA